MEEVVIPPQQKEIAIKIENISKVFKYSSENKNSIKSYFVNPFKRGKTNKFFALKNINFNVHKGEFLGIIGRNGSGKSTLLKLIAGIYAPNKGKITVEGHMVPFLELGVGFNPELTGKENVYLNGTILGMTRKYIDQKYNEIVKFAELEKFMDMLVKHYSSGMIVRLAFAIAIQADAEIFLLDEILAVGDEGFQRKSISVINDLKKQGKTVIFVSHSMDSVEKFCDRAVLIDKSQLLMDGKPTDVVNEYRRINSELNLNERSGDAEYKKRWGTHESEITKVEILDDKGAECKLFTGPGKITIRLHYAVHTDVDYDYCFGMGIYNANGKHVNGTNTRLHHVDLKLGKTGYIDYQVDSDFFIDGKYTISPTLVDYRTDLNLDWHSQMYEFEIRRFKRDAGIVALPCEWSHHPAK